MKRCIAAWISAVAGGCALTITALWYWRSWDDGLTIPPLPAGDVLNFGELYGLALLALIFQFGTPALSVPAWMFGLSARKHWAARAGMAMAALALLMYAAYARQCMKVVTGQG